MANCIVCNKEFNRKARYNGTNNYRCCSWDCRNISMRGRKPWNYGLKGIHCNPRTEFKKGEERISGKNSHLWKGGITPQRKKVRNSDEWKEWRKKVYERDDYTCQGCDSRGVKLHPHHLIARSKNPEFIFEAWNGQTLCEYCHFDLHNQLGRR